MYDIEFANSLYKMNALLEKVNTISQNACKHLIHHATRSISDIEYRKHIDFKPHHKLSALMRWSKTKETHNYWSNINNLLRGM